MREEDIPLGGGNIGAILVSGSLMFLFYEVGWSIMGTIFLVLFLIAGWKSLFPSSPLLLGLGGLCVHMHMKAQFSMCSFFG